MGVQVRLWTFSGQHRDAGGALHLRRAGDGRLGMPDTEGFCAEIYQPTKALAHLKTGIDLRGVRAESECSRLIP